MGIKTLQVGVNNDLCSRSFARMALRFQWWKIFYFTPHMPDWTKWNKKKKEKNLAGLCMTALTGRDQSVRS